MGRCIKLIIKVNSEHSKHHLVNLKYVFDMKLSNIFVGVVTGDSILPATTCATLNGDYGASLKCPYDSGYVIGFCSSGKIRTALMRELIRININVVTSMQFLLI